MTLQSGSSMAFPKNLLPTPILDFRHSRCARIVETLEEVGSDGLERLRFSHGWIVRNIRPVYNLDERQPVSRTLKRRAGSCSQRLALLEAFARSFGIPSRVRGLWISGSFWYPRFRWASCFIPGSILLAWPQFRVDAAWVGVERLFGDLEGLAEISDGFQNQGETLFEAIEHSAIDFEGMTKDCGSGRCDLSRFVVAGAGVFDSRDELFDALGSLQATVRGKAFSVLFRNRRAGSPRD